MKKGDKVKVQVKPYMTREGVFVRMIRQPVWIRLANKSGMGYPRWCYVQFRPNKLPSRVLYAHVSKIYDN